MDVFIGTGASLEDRRAAQNQRRALNNASAAAMAALAAAASAVGLEDKQIFNFSFEASQLDSQSFSGVFAACREEGPAVSPGPLLSSAVGRALLRGHAGLLSFQVEGPGGVVACHP